MTKIVKMLIVSLFISTTFLSCMSGPKVNTVTIGDPTVDLSSVEIYSINPTVVRPGVLMNVSGTGFGLDAGIITIGGIEVSTFLSWDDNNIWFAVPDGLPEDAELQVGFEIADAYITTAPEDSIMVEWTVDIAGVQEMINTKYTQFDLDKAPKWTAPFYIKGQWSKSEGSYGLKDEGWDGGSRQIMFNVPGTETWILQAIFTPEAVESFGSSKMAFAMEDGDDEYRNLSTFESDFAYIVKKKWASSLGLTNDPALSISDSNKSFDPTTRTIKIKYPENN